MAWSENTEQAPEEVAAELVEQVGEIDEELADEPAERIEAAEQ